MWSDYGELQPIQKKQQPQIIHIHYVKKWEKQMGIKQNIPLSFNGNVKKVHPIGPVVSSSLPIPMSFSSRKLWLCLLKCRPTVVYHYDDES